MAIEQTLPTPPPRRLEAEGPPDKNGAPPHILHFIEQWAHTSHLPDPAVISPYTLEGPPGYDVNSGNGYKKKVIVINIGCPGEIRLVWKHLPGLNACLPARGFLVVGLEPGRVSPHFDIPGLTGRASYWYNSFCHFLKMAVSHLPFLGKYAYRSLAGRKTAFPDMETCGRLFACGFSLLETFKMPEKIFFVAQKTRRQLEVPEADNGPIIHLKRVGKDGRRITVYKFRTMYPYSEFLQEYVYEHFGLQSGGKMKNDPRVTPLGRFLRRYWLDELPMIINLLKGELKLFGVRPLSEQYLSLYPEEYQKYRSCFKPGLIPPFYADLPEALDEIITSEKRYLEAYERQPLLTDWRYFRRAVYNIFLKGIRSG